jgi:hypothetical protein
MTTKPTDAHDDTPATEPLALSLHDQLGPLVACPLCGADKGYKLSEGSTYRWWDLYCAGCGGTVAECSSDRRTQLGTELPARWPAADEAWNSVGAHAHNLRTLLARYRDETPLGNQPHMIAHQADEALGRA